MKHPEQDIQKLVLQHLKWRGYRDIFFFHPANGGYRKPVEAAILYSLGLVAGVPDLIILKDGHCYGLELKTEKGKLSESQGKTIELMRTAGCTVGICYGLADALAWLEGQKLIKPEVGYGKKGVRGNGAALSGGEEI